MKNSSKKSGSWASASAAADLVGQAEDTVMKWVHAGLVRVDRIGGRPFVSIDDCREVAGRCYDPDSAVQMANAPGARLPEASANVGQPGDIPTPPGSLRTAPIGRARTRGQF